MRDYDCCGKIHASLHDLLKHCDEAHNSTSPNGHGIPMTSQRRPVMPQNQEIPRSSQPPAPPSTPQPTQRTVVRPSVIPTPEAKPKALLSPIPDLDDEVPDMEMDEENDASRNLPRPPVVPINTALPPQPFRASAPTTPAASQAFQLFGNPTVSSVNTPTLSTQSASQVDAIAMNSTDAGYQQFIFSSGWPDGASAELRSPQPGPPARSRRTHHPRPGKPPSNREQSPAATAVDHQQQRAFGRPRTQLSRAAQRWSRPFSSGLWRAGRENIPLSGHRLRKGVQKSEWSQVPQGSKSIAIPCSIL